METSRVCKDCKENKAIKDYYTHNGYVDRICKVCYVGKILQGRRDNKRPCQVQGCTRVHYGLDYCRNHYEQFKRGGVERVQRVYVGNVDSPRNLRKYGLTLEEFMLMSMNGCQICHSTNGSFAIDHDHKCCNEVPYCGDCTRGYVCQSCNISIGKYEAGQMHPTNPVKDKVIRYLVNHDITLAKKGLLR